MITIEIDGKTLEVEKDIMIIEAADDVGIYIPRFCYHRQLSIAANCRMCLVEIANSKKTVPACATPVTAGMKIFTKSEETLRSQKAVMDFLLINHPLDCPICDQGGECELQDISMGFGSDASFYQKSKRAVVNDNLGSLIATDMTRCIHCTRCVRFGDEIAGLNELGMLGRGEKAHIGTYVQHSMISEISGNIIDLCPVGALTSKPYRFTARPWELTQFDSIAPHDCLGSNVYVHVRNNQVMRVVPKENININESWLSDRDRFGYLGLNSDARAKQPMIKKQGQWQEVDWETALKFTANGINKIIKQHGQEQFAAFASSSSTLEEFYLLQKLMRSIGVNNIDHRLQQIDFRDQENFGIMPSNTLPYAEIETQKTILLFGCNITQQVPLAGVRIRKAINNGAKTYAINSIDYEFHFSLANKILVHPHELPIQLAQLLHAMLDGDISKIDSKAQNLLIGLNPNSNILDIAKSLKNTNSAIITGVLIDNHPEAALIRTLLYLLNKHCHIDLIHFSAGANVNGAWLAGMLPHRNAEGKTTNHIGYNVQEALQAKLKGYLLMGVEPGYDFANPYQARQSMLSAEFVTLITAYQDESMYDYADVILPYAPYAETSGTYINIDNIWQTVNGAIAPYAQSRPAWKIIRVLANLLGLSEFNYNSTAEILSELQSINHLLINKTYLPYNFESLPLLNSNNLIRIGECPMYCCDPIVRHADALQKSIIAESAAIRIHPETAKQLNLREMATISQGDIEITLPIKLDERIIHNVIWVAHALPETVDLGYTFASIDIK